MSVLLGGSSGALPHLVVPLDDASRIGEARRLARDLAESMGFDETSAGRISVAVTELGSNLLKHARGGRICIAVREAADGVCLELVSMDEGPGMANPAQCLADGYSTAGSLGQGLGAVRRLADDFDLYSAVGQGTLVLARFRNGPPPGTRPAPARTDYEMGFMCVPAPGEVVSGDAWALSVDGNQATVMMADGLGHGAGAAEAGMMAQRIFSRSPGAVLTWILEQSHVAMRSTRGAAVTLARLNAATHAIDIVGAGNVMCRVISGIEDKSGQVQNGTVGIQLRTPREQAMAWPQHALFILFTDGLQSRWTLDPAVLRCDTALIAAFLVWRFSRGRDDATVLVMRRA